MLAHQARRGGGRSGAAHIARPPVLGIDEVERALDTGLDEGPGAHILRLFLAPCDRGLLEAAELLDERLVRPGIELLDAQEIDVLESPLLALVIEIIIDLARAHHHAPD